jgi:uncharacterized membrane protein YdjX (TVP38/TMEM64 family)
MRARPAAKVGAVLAVAALLLAGQHAGLFERVHEPARIADALVALGPWGYVGFVVVFALFQPFGVPGVVFVAAAALIWPWPIAFAVSMTGTMAASAVGFGFARLVARDWVAPRVPARFARYEEALAERAFLTVFVLRTVFWMQPLLHAFFGVSRVPFWTHFWASFAGYLAPIFLLCYFGERLFEALKDASPTARLAVAAVAAAVIVIGALARRRLRKDAEGP